MKMKFNDSAEFPIVAFDFDDTINVKGCSTYPRCGEVRKYAREVINLLRTIGIKIVIWTSRDVAYNQEENKMYDHLTPMIKFLNDNGVGYDAINKSVQFAPYPYNGRKIYAHMYVDDRGFGWHSIEQENIMLSVLESILINILGIDDDTTIIHTLGSIINGESLKKEVLDELEYAVEHWKD